MRISESPKVFQYPLHAIWWEMWISGQIGFSIWWEFFFGPDLGSYFPQNFSEITDWLHEQRDPPCNIQLQTSIFKPKDCFKYQVLWVTLVSRIVCIPESYNDHQERISRRSRNQSKLPLVAFIALCLHELVGGSCCPVHGCRDDILASVHHARAPKY